MTGRSLLGVAVQHHDPVVRENIAEYLLHQPGITVVSAVESLRALTELCDLPSVAVVLFEAATLPSENARSAAQLVRGRGHRLRVFEIHEASPSGHVIRAHQPGVIALVPYSSKLTTALMAVPAVGSPPDHRIGDNSYGLTDRELDVLYLISAACPSRRIASELGISLSTVHHHQHRIYDKLGAHNQAHAVASALRGSLLRVVIRLPSAPKRVRTRPLRVHVLAPIGNSTAERVFAALSRYRLPACGLDGDAADDCDAGVLVLVDPEPEGWQGARSGARVIVATDPEPNDVAGSLARGVTIVPADRIDDLLATAVYAADHGYMMVDTAHSEGLLGRTDHEPSRLRQPKPVVLTGREREIVAAIAAGQSTKQTARLLGISVRTVENLQGNLFRKLGVHSRTAMLGAVGVAVRSSAASRSAAALPGE